MNTTDTYTKDGLFNPFSKKGNDEALIKYIFTPTIDIIDYPRHGELYMQQVISVTNKYRMDLRQKAMAIYGD